MNDIQVVGRRVSGGERHRDRILLDDGVAVPVNRRVDSHAENMLMTRREHSRCDLDTVGALLPWDLELEV